MTTPPGFTIPPDAPALSPSAMIALGINNVPSASAKADMRARLFIARYGCHLRGGEQFLSLYCGQVFIGLFESPIQAAAFVADGPQEVHRGR